MQFTRMAYLASHRRFSSVSPRPTSLAPCSTKSSNDNDRWAEVAVVTGGSRGIGRGVAEMLAERGHRLVVISKSEKCHEVAASLPRPHHKGQGKENREGHIGLQVDVSSSAQVAAAAEKIRKEIGNIKVLVNSAGVVRDSLLPYLSDEHLAEVMGTNLLGSIYFVRAFSKHFIRQGSGVIVNMGSVVGLQGQVGQTAYAASKSALVGVTKTWAKELGPKGIRVNLIAPGAIETDMTAQLTDAQRARIVEKSVLRRLGRVEEVVSAVRFVIENEFVTGQILTVDGGASLE